MQLSTDAPDLSKMSLASIVKSIPPEQQREFLWKTGLVDDARINRRKLSEIEADAKAGFLEFLDPAEQAVLRYAWRFWARPNQIVDMDDDSWTSWLFLMGRGSGKTRSGAEWVRSLVESSQTPLRINLIGPTASDTRDVMVRGDSGILACSPPWLKAEYSPSNRRVTWANGSMATLFSAEEPERLRGPQAHYQWCFPAGTAVSMADGSTKPIESVVVGDLVMTRKGARRVLASGMTQRGAELVSVIHNESSMLTCTANHLIWTDERGWVRADQLQEGEWLNCLSTLSNDRISSSTCHQPASSSSAKNGIVAGTATSSAGRLAGSCTAPSTKACSVQSQPVGMSTTWTAITRIITSATSWLSRQTSTHASTASERRTRSGRRRLLRTLSTRRGAGENTLSFRVPNAGLHSRAVHSSHGTLVRLAAWSVGATARLTPSLTRSGAPDAIRHSSRNADRRSTVLKNATSLRLGHGVRPRLVHETSPVLAADLSSAVRDRTRSSAAENVAWPSMIRSAVTRSARPAGRADVYDITVEGEHEFFADGVLVHNCDELCSWKAAEDVWNMSQMGLRLGRSPRNVITTTPKPTELLKKLLAEKTTRLITGSTYDNSDNLAPTFIKTIISKYEGTDLGRQELHAELLLENKNALWSRGLLAATRVQPTDVDKNAMSQIVVAVDPPASSGEQSDECGLVVCGLGANKRGYVLADLSGRMTPKKWAQTALQAAKDFQADRIVAERNNGGEMVKHTIRSFREGGLDGGRVHVKTVFASRGKWTRAEPIAALFQQHRAHLVGVHPKLEDQLTSYDPFEGQKSPDRFDAMVWGLTDLMLRGGSRFFL